MSHSPHPGPRESGLTSQTDPGLLEQVALLFRPEVQGRRLLLAASGLVVGFSSWSSRGWWRGLPWSLLTVHEEEQSPLVFTIHKRFPFPLRREVRDAEGELVGLLVRGAILDRWQQTVMWVESTGQGVVCRDLRGQALARWSETRLDLERGVWHDPFAKMLILAASLTMGP